MEDIKPYDDLTLFALIAKGNEEAFRIIFHQYTRKLYPFIFSIVKSETNSKEIIQQVFLELWLNREGLASVEKPGAWLHRVTANACFDFLSAEAKYSLRLKKARMDDSSANLMDELDARFTQRMIAEAIEQLPFKRRQVFRMARMEGMSRREIASELNISENTVRNQLTSAVRSIQGYLTQKGALYVPVLLLLLKDF